MRVVGARHGDGAAVVAQAVHGLVFDRGAGGFLLHARTETAALDHETGDNTMKNRAVVEPFLGIGKEIGDGLGRLLRVEFEHDGAVVGLHSDHGEPGVSEQRVFSLDVKPGATKRGVRRQSRFRYHSLYEQPPLKTRFAPSPTGRLHLGNIRTALFNWLLARRHGGAFLLRLEDTDAMRGHEKYALALQEDLRWMGLVWDEGPDVGGAHGPYAQSERGEIYKSHFLKLEQDRLAYPCFCTEHELAIERKVAIASHLPPRYSGKCRALSPDDVRPRFGRGEPATLRFRVPAARKVGFDDKVRGPQVFDSADIGDFVIRRSDGTPAFFFCNAVDDALMQVTLVVRGEDHLTNTPRQIMLLEALGLPAPEYAHIALVVDADGTPLSKRTGSQSVEELRAAGLPAGGAA